ncbi:HAD family hydrolase [Spongiivirga citrea]|uniref:HAD-IA family hydrolase n=1 Tax=Spongiivirga citrea TaxID=1481457 RepID=A0A6M0CGP0_9FLAO|nr:HAD family phosphatase [Spongiivirga citrea]NER16662.1 HAD-IA family hydrolase [Spongiivirga citrea]
MPQIKNIIFDLGGVLIDWNPEYVYLDVFNGDRQKMKWFFDNICTMDWNENQDAGYPLAKATQERVAMFPEHEELIRMYYGRWEEMLGEQITPTVNLLKQLVDNDRLKVVALTNWSAETWPVAIERFEFLQWFEGIIVSGTEKMRKPFKEIYDLTLSRFDLIAEESIFIDDNARNIAAANKMGINGIHFTGADVLISQLNDFNIKID